MVALKSFLRDLMPASAQVPAKYHYDRARGRLEPEMRLLDRLVQPGQRAIDIGGNRGVYSYRLWKLGVTLEIFEPNPDCLRVLDAWSKGRPRVTCHPVALSSHAGSAVLHIPVDAAGREHDASASLEHHDFVRSRDRSVTLATLDSYRFAEVGFIKIDVEGHEYSVIEGAAETLRASRPALLVEIEQRHCGEPIAHVFDRILRFGYRGCFIWQDALHPLSRFNPVEHQCMERFGKSGLYMNNFLFLHEARCAKGEYDGLLPIGSR